MSLPQLAVRRPVTMTMISAVIVLIGAVALMRLPVDLMPDVTFPSLTVRVAYADVGPLEMEELVTRPIEQRVSAIAGLQEITSTSSEGQSQVRLSFDWGSDLNEAADDLRSRLDFARAQLPEDADPPVMYKFDASSMPILFMGLSGDLDPVELREMAENDLGPRLERIPGVASVSVRGGLRRQIHVELAKDKITALDLAVDQVIALLQRENQNLPIGQLDDADMTYLLRSPGQFTSLEDIRNVVVLVRGGVPVYLRDIAVVSDGTEDREDLVRINGRPGVQVSVSKQSGRNTVAVAQAVRAEVARINQEMPAIELTIRMDSAIFIERSIAAVRKFLFEGSLDYIADGAGLLETRLQQGIFGIEFENGDRFFAGATDNYEFLKESFDIHKDVTIPVGGYSFTNARVVYALGQQRTTSGGLTFDRGQFFGGEWTSVGYFRGRINLSPQLSLEPSLSFNWIELPQGDFRTELVTTRAIYTLTPRMFVAALLQYNSGSDSLGTNIRLRWEYQPGSELFVVYTDERDTLTPRFRGLENRAFVVKFNRLFRF